MKTLKDLKWESDRAPAPRIWDAAIIGTLGGIYRGTIFRFNQDGFRCRAGHYIIMQDGEDVWTDIDELTANCVVMELTMTPLDRFIRWLRNLRR